MGLSTGIAIYNLTDTTLNCTQHHSYQMYDWDDNFGGATVNSRGLSAFEFEYHEAYLVTRTDDAAEATFTSSDGLLQLSLAAKLTETHTYGGHTYANHLLSVQISYLNNHQSTNPPYYCVLNGQKEIKLIPSDGASASVYLGEEGVVVLIITIEGNIPPSLRMDRMASTEIMNAIQTGNYSSDYYQKFKTHLLNSSLIPLYLSKTMTF